MDDFFVLEQDEYIKAHIFWGIVNFAWLHNLLFRCIPHCTYIESLIIFIISFLVIITICILITKEKRTYRNLFGNITLAWGVYFCLANFELYRKRIVWVVIITVAISLLLSILILFRKIPGKNKRKIKILKRRFMKLLILWKNSLTITAILLMLPAFLSTLLYDTILNSKVEIIEEVNECDFQTDIKMVAKIYPDTWELLSLQERLDVAQIIVNNQVEYYGISHEISVGVGDLSFGTLGYYRDSTHQIVLDYEHLKESHSYLILETLMHEVNHVYTHELVRIYTNLSEEDRDLKIFHDIDIYTLEYEHYVDGSDDDFEKYYNQLVETHAREAGTEEAFRYIQLINEYLEIDENLEGYNSIGDYIYYLEP